MKWATSVSVPKRPNLRDTHANCVSLGMSAIEVGTKLFKKKELSKQEFDSFGTRAI